MGMMPGSQRQRFGITPAEFVTAKHDKRRPHSWKNPAYNRQERCCPYCGKKFVVYPSRAEVHCSLSCAQKARWRSPEKRAQAIASLAKRDFVGSKNPNYGNHELKGLKVPEERTRRSMETFKRNFALGKYPKRIAWNLGIRLSEERKTKMRAISLRYYEQHPELKAYLREQRLKQVIPKKDTSIERKLKEALIAKNLRFKSNVALLNLAQTDIFIQPSLCIFIDGCYWHVCKQCFPHKEWSGWLLRRLYADRYITAKLVSAGYVVLRYWEHEINNEVRFTQIVNEILVLAEHLLIQPPMFSIKGVTQ